MTLQTPPAFSGLARLADQTGLDIRPTLLRVLTDLYVLKPSHTEEEERHYVELAMRLIDGVDVASRVILAERLSKFAAAPRSIVQRLARDVFDVAVVILSQSTALEQAELVAIAEECGPAYAAIIAQRADIRALMESDQQPPDIVPEVVPLQAEPEPAATDKMDASAPAESAPDENIRPTFSIEQCSRLSELFLTSPSADRKMILMNLDYALVPPAESVTETRSREAIRRLEHAALSRQPRAFARVLSESLGLSIRLAQDLIDDMTGEPIVVLAKALRMPSDILQRVLLFLNPEIGESVRQVYELATLYDEISHESALRLVTIWKTSDTRRFASHESVMWDDEIARARSTVRQQNRSATPLAASSSPRRFHGGLAVRT